MSKKTILHIIDLSMTGGKQEGALSAIVSQPFKEKYNQSVFNTEKRSVKKRYSEELVKNGIPFYEANTGFPINSKLVRKLIFLNILIKVKPDIIVLWSVLPTFLYFLVKNVLNFKTVFWDRGVSSSRPPKQSIIFSLSKCDLILCNSEATKILLKNKWYVNDAQVCLNAVRDDVIPKKKPVKTYITNTVKLGFAGRLVPVKGVGLIIETVKILNDRRFNVELFIAGEKNEEFVFLKNLAKKMGVEKKIHFLGNLSDMKNFYQKIDIFLCPSLREPFGLVSVEAASNGCPVIISKIDGLAETIEDGKTGIAITPKMPLSLYKDYASTTENIPNYVYFPDKQAFDLTKAVYPEEIADSVCQIMNTERQFQNYSEAAYQRSIKMFSLSKHIDCVLKNFETLN